MGANVPQNRGRGSLRERMSGEAIGGRSEAPGVESIESWLIMGTFRGKSSMKYTADLKVTFVIEDGQPEDQAKRILYREVAQFEHAIEHGRWSENTGVEKGSAKVQILSHGPTT